MALQKWSKTVKVSLKGAESAEDLFVEAVIRVSEKLPKDSERARQIGELIDRGAFDEATNEFAKYAYRQFRNVVRAHNRRVAKEPVRFSELDETCVEPRELAELLPVTAKESEALSSRLVDALSVLPEREREVIVGKFFGGLTNGELAEELGCSEKAVRSYQSRALMSLAKLLKRL